MPRLRFQLRSVPTVGPPRKPEKCPPRGHAGRASGRHKEGFNNRAWLLWFGQRRGTLPPPPPREVPCTGRAPGGGRSISVCPQYVSGDFSEGSNFPLSGLSDGPEESRVRTRSRAYRLFGCSALLPPVRRRRRALTPPNVYTLHPPPASFLPSFFTCAF